MDSTDVGSDSRGLGVSTVDHMSTWIELFYDLIFVAAILIFSSAVEHVHSSYGITWIVLVFAASWWVWFMTTVCANRFHMSDFPHRILLLFQMLVIVLMAMEARVSVTGDSTYLAVEYGLLLLTIAIMYIRASRRPGSDRKYAARMATLNGVAGAVFVAAAPLPETARLILSGVGFALLVVPSVVFLQRMQEFSGPDERHIVERMGAFTLIVCGESFVEIALSVSNATISKVDVFSLVFEFVLVFAIFTGYFEDIPAAGLDQRRFGWWAVLHLIAQICIAGTAVSASRLIHLSTGRRLPDVEILRLTVPLAVLYLALAGVSAGTRRRPVAPLVVSRLATAGLVVVVGVIAWWIPWIHMAQALPLLTAVAILDAVAIASLKGQTQIVRSAASTG